MGGGSESLDVANFGYVSFPKGYFKAHPENLISSQETLFSFFIKTLALTLKYGQISKKGT